jgi:hypothetical protein
MPTGTDTLVGKATTDTLTNKTLTAPVLSGSVTGTYTLAGTNTLTSPIIAGTPTGVGVLTSGTAVASTSGTSIDFTGIPSWVKRITVMFNGVSTNGSSYYQIRLGTSSGVESTGYSSASMYCSTSGINAVNSTTGFQFHTITSGYNYNGSMTISLLTGSTWTETGIMANSTGGDFLFYSAGSKATSGTLDRIRITTVNGTDTFDAGSINILYE